MVFTTLSDFVEMHKAKRIRILATSGAKRSSFVPEVPTFREAGFDIEGTSWYGAFVPARTPRETVDRLSAVIAAAVRMSDVRERFLGWGLQPTGTSAAEFAAIQKADSERWAAGVKASGFTAD
jgi:tripartite-type tricarboxylate transporter receptor subunit TctC